MLRRMRRQRLQEEEVDPMGGLANLVDVMLVFACGLMVSLLLTWNMKDTVFKKVDVEKGQVLKEIPQVQENGGSGYSEMGRVYQDPKTGKLILIEEVHMEK